jgi:hypothetical protein
MAGSDAVAGNRANGITHLARHQELAIAAHLSVDGCLNSSRFSRRIPHRCRVARSRASVAVQPYALTGPIAELSSWRSSPGGIPLEIRRAISAPKRFSWIRERQHRDLVGLEPHEFCALVVGRDHFPSTSPASARAQRIHAGSVPQPSRISPRPPPPRRTPRAFPQPVPLESGSVENAISPLATAALGLFNTRFSAGLRAAHYVRSRCAAAKTLLR